MMSAYDAARKLRYSGSTGIPFGITFRDVWQKKASIFHEDIAPYATKWDMLLTAGVAQQMTISFSQCPPALFEHLANIRYL